MTQKSGWLSHPDNVSPMNFMQLIGESNSEKYVDPCQTTTHLGCSQTFNVNVMMANERLRMKEIETLTQSFYKRRGKDIPCSTLH